MLNNLRAAMNTEAHRVSAKMQQAVIDVLIHKHKWRTAAINNGCTESGICRCMKKLGLRSIVLDSRSTSLVD